jgi:hypothetical protein
MASKMRMHNQSTRGHGPVHHGLPHAHETSFMPVHMPVQIFSQHGHQVVMSPVPMPNVYDPLHMKTGALLQFYRPSGSETVRTQGMAGNVWRHILVEIPAFSFE